MQTLIRKPLAALHAMGGTHLQRSLTRQIKHVIAGHRANHPKDEWGGVGVPEWSTDAHDLDAPPKAAAAIWTGQPCQVAADALEEDGSPPRSPWLDRGKAALLHVDVGRIEPRWLSSAPSSTPPSVRSRSGGILRIDLGRIEDRLRAGWPERGRAALLHAALGRIEVRQPFSSVDSASA